MHPSDLIVRTMQRIYAQGMTTTSGGNLSVLDAEGDLWITPSRVDKGSLTVGDIVCVRRDGTIDGRHKPSSEYPFHLAILRARPDLRAVVHAHVPTLSAFAVTRRVPDTAVLPQARFVCGQVAGSAYVIPGSDELGRVIAERFAAGSDCVSMENHGFVFGGETLQQAFERMETLEFTARVITAAETLGGCAPLSDSELGESARAMNMLPEFRAPTPSAREQELRRQLCDFARRGYEQGMVISTEGSLSARLEGDAVLFTPFGRDRATLQPEDIVLVKGGRREAGKLPSRALPNHLAIYRAQPWAGAVFNALPPHTTAFSIARDARLESRIIPESYLLLRDVPVLPYAGQYGDGSAVAGMVSREAPVLLFRNNGAIAVGGSVLEAFDRMEVLENTAKVLIAAKALGPAHLIGEDGIQGIRKAFLGG
ncbi:MAG: class II aldolase/adducin family protein [Planctomycetes bacterium]|nr:class II aldolase/adducin family protein [Planctomycetota bacterium]